MSLQVYDHTESTQASIPPAEQRSQCMPYSVKLAIVGEYRLRRIQK